MISRHTLEKAAEQNIIDSQQVEPLYQFITKQNIELDSESHEEPLKFIRSFGDIFITLGVVLLVISINMTQITGYYYLFPAVGFILIAEWLVRVRRLALPGIAILLSILFFISKALNVGQQSNALTLAAVLAASSFLFYLRYKMPFSLLPLFASLVAMVVLQLGLDVIKTPAIFVGLGLIIFSVAMWYDSRDTRRLSHLSDNAFWLHLLASPLIVHGVMVTMLMSDASWVEVLNKEVLIMIFFSGFFLLALLVDRRAMLISTQLYVIYSLTHLLRGNLDSAQNVMVYVLIILGLFVIFFGTYWYKTRRLVFARLAGSRLSHYIPDLAIEDVKQQRKSQ